MKMNKIEKEGKNDTADISDKGNSQKNKNRILRPAREFQANWDLDYTYFQSLL